MIRYFLIGAHWRHAYPIGVRVFFHVRDWKLRRNYYPETNTTIYDLGPLQFTIGGND